MSFTVIEDSDVDILIHIGHCPSLDEGDCETSWLDFLIEIISPQAIFSLDEDVT